MGPKGDGGIDETLRKVQLALLEGDYTQQMGCVEVVR